MGFIKWLWQQYKVYKKEQSKPKRRQEDKNKVFLSAYTICLKEGFTVEQVNALITLFCAGRN